MLTPVANAEFLRTPLWPAGHLPLKGGDWQFYASRWPCEADDWRKSKCQSISPLEGEMSGRTEGGEARQSNASALRPLT